MECGNHSTVTEFILLGLSNDPNLQTAIFVLFFIVYLCTLSANVLLIAVVRIDHRLHTSMYFFLVSLSFQDICYTSVIIPNMLVSCLTLIKTISFIGCMIQVYLYLLFGESNCILLAFMAYDRFVAICYPLRYNMMMSTMVCVRMIIVTYVAAYIISSIDLMAAYHLTYEGPNTIDHFFCETPSLVQLACDYTTISKTVVFTGSVILLITPLFFITLSYIQIVIAVAKIHSGRYKVFSKCMPHIIVVVLYYGANIFIYMLPRDPTKQQDKMVSVFYTSVIPMLNPLIYSLRNQDVQKAIIMLKRYTIFLK